LVSPGTAISVSTQGSLAENIGMVATGQEIVREKNSSRSGKSQGISL